MERGGGEGVKDLRSRKINARHSRYSRCIISAFTGNSGIEQPIYGKMTGMD